MPQKQQVLSSGQKEAQPMAVSARPSAPETAGKRLDPKPAARQATVAPSSSPVSVQRPPPQPSLQQLPKLQQPQLLPTDLSMDGLSWVSLGILAALVQACGGPGSPMGQLLLAGEAAFATWTMARYLSYNGSVLSSSRSQPARDPEEVEALWRLFSHNRAGLLRHVSLESFITDWFWEDDRSTAAATAAAVSGQQHSVTAAAAVNAAAEGVSAAAGAGSRGFPAASVRAAAAAAAANALSRLPGRRRGDQAAPPGQGRGLGIRRGDAAEFLSYAFWGCTREEVEALPGGPAALSAKLRDLERAAGAPLLPGGPTPGRRIMAHLREPLKVSYRPAVLYGITELLSVAKRLGLAQRGYHKWTHPLFAAYTLEPRLGHSMGAAANATAVDSSNANNSASASKAAATAALLRTAHLALTQQQLLQPMREAAIAAAAAADSAAAVSSSPSATPAVIKTGDFYPSSGHVGEANQYDRPPIVVLHGLGIGLLPYQRLLDELAAACPDRRLVVLEYKHVAMRLTTQVPSVDEMAAAVGEALDALGHRRAVLLGHSYGTLVASRFAKLYPERVHAMVLLDAVCFGMVMPQLLRGSLFYHLRPPKESAAQQRRRHRAATAAANVAVADAAAAAATAAAKAAAAAEAAAAAAGLPAPPLSAPVPVLPPRASSVPPSTSPPTGIALARSGSAGTTLVVPAAEEVQRALTRLQQARVAAEQQALAAAAATAAAGFEKAGVVRAPVAAPEGAEVVDMQGQTVVVEQEGKAKQKQEEVALGVAAEQRTLGQGLLDWGARASAVMWGAAVAAEARAREWAWVTFKGMFVRDLHTAVAMTVRFRWADMNMWPADLPPHSLVVLGGRDYLMSAPSLGRMLHGAGYGDCVMLHPDLDHGEVLKDPVWRPAVLRRVASLVAEADAELDASAQQQQQPKQQRLAGHEHARRATLAQQPLPLPLGLSNLLLPPGAQRAAARRLLRRLAWSLPPLPGPVEQRLLGLLPAPLSFDVAQAAAAEAATAAATAGAAQLGKPASEAAAAAAAAASVAAVTAVEAAGGGAVSGGGVSEREARAVGAAAGATAAAAAARTGIDAAKPPAAATAGDASPLLDGYVPPYVEGVQAMKEVGAIGRRAATPASCSVSINAAAAFGQGSAHGNSSSTPTANVDEPVKPITADCGIADTPRQVDSSSSGGGDAEGASARRSPLSGPAPTAAPHFLRRGRHLGASLLRPQLLLPRRPARGSVKAHAFRGSAPTSSLSSNSAPSSNSTSFPTHGKGQQQKPQDTGSNAQAPAQAQAPTHHMHTVAVPACLPESTVRTLLLLPESTARLMPVLPELLARAAPVLAEMWEAVKPLMPKLLKAILPVMPRFLMALMPLLPRALRKQPAAASAVVSVGAAGGGVGGAAGWWAAGKAGGGVSSRSVWERTLGVAGTWAAVLALLPEASMPYMPSTANMACCAGGGGAVAGAGQGQDGAGQEQEGLSRRTSGPVFGGAAEVDEEEDLSEVVESVVGKSSSGGDVVAGGAFMSVRVKGGTQGRGKEAAAAEEEEVVLVGGAVGVEGVGVEEADRHVQLLRAAMAWRALHGPLSVGAVGAAAAATVMRERMGREVQEASRRAGEALAAARQKGLLLQQQQVVMLVKEGGFVRGLGSVRVWSGRLRRAALLGGGSSRVGRAGGGRPRLVLGA